MNNSCERCKFVCHTLGGGTAGDPCLCSCHDQSLLNTEPLSNIDEDRISIDIVRVLRTSPPKVQLLFSINLKMWDKEDEITAAAKAGDMAKVGELYMELRALTKERAAIKGETKTY